MWYCTWYLYRDHTYRDDTGFIVQGSLTAYFVTTILDFEAWKMRFIVLKSLQITALLDSILLLLLKLSQLKFYYFAATPCDISPAIKCLLRSPVSDVTTIVTQWVSMGIITTVCLRTHWDGRLCQRQLWSSIIMPLVSEKPLSKGFL